MAGHASEKRWGVVSDEANRRLGKLMQFLRECEALHQEFELLWEYCDEDSTCVAALLFDGYLEGDDQPSHKQMAMVEDLKAALAAASHLAAQTDSIKAIKKMI
jgi:hypothetical protein